MKKTNRRAFTIVELVIVIAVIAVLAGILIPTFSSLINKANVSSDTQLVRNLNTALASDNKKHNTMQDALQTAKEFGYDVDRINASATNNQILWDSKNDVFCYEIEGVINYIPESNLEYTDINYVTTSYENLKVNMVDLWMISNELPSEAKYSVYAGNNWNDVGSRLSSLKVGFDVGENNINTINYVGNDGINQNVIIRTNDFATLLTIDDESTTGKIYHYGYLGKLTIVNCAMESYHEKGVVGFVEVNKGHLAVEENATINLVFANPSSTSDIKITNNGTVSSAQASNEEVKGSDIIVGVEFNLVTSNTITEEIIKNAVEEIHQNNCEHKNVVVSKEAVEATCTQKGSTEEKKCDDCGKIMIEQQEIPMLQHTLTHYVEVPATCTVDGNVEYNHCSICNNNYNNNGDLFDSVVIEATGSHIYDLHKCTVCEEDEPGWEGFGGKVDENGKINDSAFVNNTDITSIIIPEGVTEIGNFAFKKCTNLTSVTISSTVETIGEQAFNGCTKLSSITIPSTVKIVSKKAFYECTELNSLTILNGVQKIQDSAFGYCNNLQSVTIPSSVTNIGSSAFCECTSLTSVVIQSTATIQAGAFQNCTKLSTIELHSAQITTVLFAGCTSLSTVKFGAEVKSITANAFSNTPIVTVEVDTQNTNYKHDDDKDCVLSYDGKTLVLGCVNTTIPSTVTTIGTYSFHKRNITRITIPSSVTKIEQYAFQDSSLTSATLSSNNWKVNGSSISRILTSDSENALYLSGKKHMNGSTNLATVSWTK